MDISKAVLINTRKELEQLKRSIERNPLVKATIYDYDWKLSPYQTCVAYCPLDGGTVLYLVIEERK